MKSDMKLDELARYVLVAGGVLVMLAACLIVGGMVMKKHYRYENEKAFEAIGRELSGTNDQERKRIGRIRTTGIWTLGLGVVAMGIGGVFYYYGSKQKS